MFPWSNLIQKKTRLSPARRPRATLQIEVLEGRDCPSAPQITAFAVTVQTGTTVLLSGTIIDDNPTAARVCFGGVATSSVTPDASGNFQLQESLAQPGTVYAGVQDPNGSYSNQAQAMVADPGMSLGLNVSQSGPNRTVTVTGQVSSTDWSVGGSIITLSGVVSASVTTNTDGTFTYTGTASALGQVQAAVSDDWGGTFTSSAMLTDTPPSIVNFQAVNNGNNNWTFTGQVQYPYAQGLVVTLSGIPSLNNANVSAVVQKDGSFSITVTLQPGENGSVTAGCVDWWGQAAQQTSVYVWN